VQLAYCIPYTYSRLGEFLQGLSSRPEAKQFLKISKLCSSLGGLEVPLLVVHQGLEDCEQEEEGVPTRCVVVSGRAHPGESNGSFMIEGFIEWLCGDSKEACILRRFLVFKIVPMLNPDGVALGNYRTGLSGRDFNREYRMPDKALFPEVYHFKKLVSENKELFGDRLLMFLDFHGHSTKKNTFVYGPEFPIIDKFYY
jgi:murein tripeptide amidase MpaA